MPDESNDSDKSIINTSPMRRMCKVMVYNLLILQ
jgi:hypothetical protein